VIGTLLGGLGLFLLGMVLMTDGLKAAAGDALRGVLTRFTGGPVKAVASGAAVTALVQSSSATVLTTIGFVSAGLLAFPQAVGVIFGASLGTTSTGWIVSLLGLKLNVGTAALPLIGVGALMRLLSKGRAAQFGLALAGFGLIFVGIDLLQQGMRDLGTRIDPGAFPGATIPGRLALVVVGLVMTVVMQSSSAAVATTLTALHTGTIDIVQAASLVVGQSVGTTVTAGLASIGASVPARRTALAHILFNAAAGVIAFLMIPLVPHAHAYLTAAAGVTEPALVIAGFHTAFNLLAVLMLTPFASAFAAQVMRLVPDRGPALTRFLDESVTRMPAVALESASRTVEGAAAELVEILRAAAAQPLRRAIPRDRLDAADAALAETRRFMAAISASEGTPERERHLSLLHAIDHLDRLIERLASHTPPRPVSLPAFDELRARARVELEPIIRWLRGADPSPPVALAEALASASGLRRRDERITILEATADGAVDPDNALEQLEAMRWLDSSLYHVWRAVHHLAAPQPVARTEAEV
jgi:phosphate:Na+ symporter